MSEKNKLPPKRPTATKAPATAAPVRRDAGHAPPQAAHKPPTRADTATKPRQQGRFRRDIVLSAVLGGLVVGLVIAFVYGLYMPKAPWAFDRPEAQLPSLQARHTLQ